MTDKTPFIRVLTALALVLALTAAALPAVAAPADAADRGADLHRAAAWDLLADGWSAVVSWFTVTDDDGGLAPADDPQAASGPGGDSETNDRGQMDPNG